MCPGVRSRPRSPSWCPDRRRLTQSSWIAPLEPLSEYAAMETHLLAHTSKTLPHRHVHAEVQSPENRSPAL